MATTTAPLTTTEAEAIRQSLIAEANRAHAQYPQYKGHWDGFILVRATRVMRGKGGLYAEAGELLLAQPEVSPPSPYDRYPGVAFRTMYSNRLGWDFSQRDAWVVVVPTSAIA